MNALSNTVSSTFSETIQTVASVDVLFASYRSRLLRLAYRITGNHEDAEDAVQETLYRAITRAHQFQGQSQFTTWLTRIAINQALTCLRRRKRDRVTSLDEYFTSDEDTPRYELRDARPMPDSALSAQESTLLLERCIARLPRIYREIIKLYYVDELSITEVRETLSLTEPTTKSRMVRARRMLRTQMVPRRGALVHSLVPNLLYEMTQTPHRLHAGSSIVSQPVALSRCVSPAVSW
jgi:RNA polymerase sigma-70 factor (ECF subfamily)